jgi:hypothetical protein
MTFTIKTVNWTTQPHPLGGCVPRLRGGWIPAQAPNLRSHPDGDLAALALSIRLQKYVSFASPADAPPTFPSPRGFGVDLAF